MNNFQFAIMLATLLFGGHSALHRWDMRQTRRAALLRACRVPERVARAWVECQVDGGSVKLWLQFTEEQPQMVVQGSKACAKAVTRLKAAGITVDSGAIQKEKLAPHDGGAQGMPGQQCS